MTRCFRQFFTRLLLTLSIVAIGVQGAWAQAKLQTLDSPQGGTIYYGAVEGANTQSAAIIAMLRMAHQSCGEKPQIIQAFKVRGTDSAGLFFTVVNRAQGNRPVAGLIVAAAAGPNHVEAAMIANTADRFSSAVNPMLQRLLSVWHPSGLEAAPGSPAGAKTAPGAASEVGAHADPAGGRSAAAAKLHPVTASDNSVSVGIPDGWQVDPQSGGGSIRVLGPNGEIVGLNLNRTAIDPTNPQQRQLQRYGVVPGIIVYPFNGDLVKAFPGILQLFRRAGGVATAELQIDKTEQLPAGQGQHCVHVTGHLSPDGKGMLAMNTMMCVTDPGPAGYYMVSINNALLPTAVADKERDTVAAIVTSLRLNMDVLNQQMAQANQQAIAGAQRAVDRIHQIGAQATARYNATQAANDAQHAAWWADQDNKAKRAQGFTNYQRDQTVVRDVQEPNVHATVGNRTAAWLQQAFPDRIEEVPTSEYIKGQDF